jgi:hypothetical protein
MGDDISSEASVDVTTQKVVKPGNDMQPVFLYSILYWFYSQFFPDFYIHNILQPSKEEEEKKGEVVPMLN